MALSRPDSSSLSPSRSFTTHSNSPSPNRLLSPKKRRKNVHKSSITSADEEGDIIEIDGDGGGGREEESRGRRNTRSRGGGVGATKDANWQPVGDQAPTSVKKTSTDGEKPGRGRPRRSTRAGPSQRKTPQTRRVIIPPSITSDDGEDIVTKSCNGSDDDETYDEEQDEEEDEEKQEVRILRGREKGKSTGSTNKRIGTSTPNLVPNSRLKRRRILASAAADELTEETQTGEDDAEDLEPTPLPSRRRANTNMTTTAASSSTNRSPSRLTPSKQNRQRPGGGKAPRAAFKNLTSEDDNAPVLKSTSITTPAKQPPRPSPGSSPSSQVRRRAAPGGEVLLDRMPPNGFCDFCSRPGTVNSLRINKLTAIEGWPNKTSPWATATVISKENSETEGMVSCWECGSSGHWGCLQITQKVAEAAIKYPWACLNCRRCEMCDEKGEDHNLLFCDECDRGWHMSCVGLKDVPEGDWKCDICRDGKSATLETSQIIIPSSTIASKTPLSVPSRNDPNPYSSLSDSTTTPAVAVKMKVNPNLTKTGPVGRILREEGVSPAPSPSVSFVELPGNLKRRKSEADVLKEAISSPATGPASNLTPPNPSGRLRDKGKGRANESPTPVAVGPRIKLPAGMYGGDSATQSSRKIRLKMPDGINLGKGKHSINQGGLRSSSRSNKTPRKAPRVPTSSDEDEEPEVEEEAESSEERTEEEGQQEEEESDGEVDPFGGILTPEQADTTGLIPTDDDVKRFQTALQNARKKINDSARHPTALSRHGHTLTGSPSTPIASTSAVTIGSERTLRERPPPTPVNNKAARSVPTPSDAIQATPSVPATPGLPPQLAQELAFGSNIKWIHFGPYEIKTWFQAPYPEEYIRPPDETLRICQYCLGYLDGSFQAWRHSCKLHSRQPPGDEIYRDGEVSIFEVDGRKSKIYCQNLCLLAKMFLDHKTLYYDVEPFLFYVMTERTSEGHQFVGYFSKEKRSPTNNVSCIMTLPIRQRRGWGNLLIDFSYLLSKKEGRLGTPEKPLSDLGLLSYRNYWREAILKYLKDVTDQSKVTIEDISAKTSMMVEDVYWILRDQHLLSLVTSPEAVSKQPSHPLKSARKRKRVDDDEDKIPKRYIIKWNTSDVESLVQKIEEKKGLRLRPENLRWVPFLVAAYDADFDVDPVTSPTIIAALHPPKRVSAVTDDIGTITVTVETDDELGRPKKKQRPSKVVDTPARASVSNRATPRQSSSRKAPSNSGDGRKLRGSQTSERLTRRVSSRTIAREQQAGAQVTATEAQSSPATMVIQGTKPGDVSNEQDSQSATCRPPSQGQSELPSPANSKEEPEKLGTSLHGSSNADMDLDRHSGESDSEQVAADLLHKPLLGPSTNERPHHTVTRSSTLNSRQKGKEKQTVTLFTPQPSAEPHDYFASPPEYLVAEGGENMANVTSPFDADKFTSPLGSPYDDAHYHVPEEEEGDDFGDLDAEGEEDDMDDADETPRY